MGCEVIDQVLYRVRTLHKAFKISMGWWEINLDEVRKKNPAYLQSSI